jgi:hypothetical protein
MRESLPLQHKHHPSHATASYALHNRVLMLLAWHCGVILQHSQYIIYDMCLPHPPAGHQLHTMTALQHQTAQCLP